MLKMTRFRSGLRPDPAGEAYDAPPDPLVGWGGGPHTLPPRRLDLGAFGSSVVSPLQHKFLATPMAYPIFSGLELAYPLKKNLAPPPTGYNK